MSSTVQYILVFLILFAVIGWVIYNLVRKRPDKIGGCAGCALAENCRKRELAKKGESKNVETCDERRAKK